MSHLVGDADFKALQQRFNVLQRRVQLRQRKEFDQQTHDGAVLKTFMERVMGTILAWVSSSMVFSLLALPMRDNQKLTNGDAALCAFIYALLITICGPLVAYKLKDEAGRTKGNTIKDDFLKLVAASMPMILLWAWKDLADALMKHWEVPSTVWQDNVLMSLLLLAICAVAAISPPYYRAQKAIREKSAGDNLLARYITLPAALTLALAAYIFSIAAYLVGEVTKDITQDFLLKQTPNTVISFLVLLVPCLVVMILVSVVAVAWSLKSEALNVDVKSIRRTDADGDDGASADKYVACLQRSVEIELVSADIVVAGCSWVYALCLKAILTTFFNTMVFTGSLAGSYRPKFLYAVVFTFFSIRVVMLLKSEQRGRPWGKALQSMQILALALCTGWAWLDTVVAWVVAMLGSAKADKVNEILTLIYVLAFVVFWLLFTVLYCLVMTTMRMSRPETVDKKEDAPPPAAGEEKFGIEV